MSTWYTVYINIDRTIKYSKQRKNNTNIECANIAWFSIITMFTTHTHMIFKCLL